MPAAKSAGYGGEAVPGNVFLEIIKDDKVISRTVHFRKTQGKVSFRVLKRQMGAGRGYT